MTVQLAAKMKTSTVTSRNISIFLSSLVPPVHLKVHVVCSYLSRLCGDGSFIRHVCSCGQLASSQLQTDLAPLLLFPFFRKYSRLCPFHVQQPRLPATSNFCLIIKWFVLSVAHTFPPLGLHSLPTKDTRQCLAAVHFSICRINMQTNACVAVCV